MTSKTDKMVRGMALLAEAAKIEVLPPYPDGLGSWTAMKRRDDMEREGRRLVAEALGEET